MSFEVRDKDLAGRIGRLKTKSGVVETPAFFPVINPVKQGRELPSEEVRRIGFNQVITNAYIIKQSLGDKAKELGVKRVIGFSGVVMTDSGAYQILRYGRKVKIDPVEIAVFQRDIDSDIAVIADIPTRDDASYEEARDSVEETLRRARITANVIGESDVVWVLPIQGGVHLDLVARSAEEARLIDGYDMYAIGSPVTVLEKYDFRRIVDMVATAKTILPLDKPVHLFGGGHPLIIPFMVALGVDSFDSASYILYARDGRYMSENGTYRLTDLEYLPCECEVCSKYTPKDLMSLEGIERVKLLSIHNLHVINKEIKRVKTAVKEGRLWELIEERARTHPSLREALNALIKYAGWIERLDPRFKGDAHAIFLYDDTSYHRPELIRHRAFVEKMDFKNERRVILIPGAPDEKPFRTSRTYRKVLASGLIDQESRALIYIPYFNVVPVELDEVFPYSQFEMSLTPSESLVRHMLTEIRKIFHSKITDSSEVIIVTCSEHSWSRSELFEEFKKSSNVRLVELC